MRRLSRDAWLTVGLLLILVLLLIAGALREVRRQEGPALISTSAGADGALALAEWLADLGLTVDNARQSVYAVPEGTDVALLLEPSQTLDDEAWSLLITWVEDGGTLLIAGSGLAARLAFDRLALDLERLGEDAQLRWTAPLLASPPPATPEATAAWGFSAPLPETALAHVVADDTPVVVTLTRGAGRIVAVSSAVLFSNSGLRAAGVPLLVLNLVTGSAAAPQTVWFDEWHHGLRTLAPLGPSEWLRRTPAGRALLLTALLIFVAVLLSGRRLGRAVPLPETRRRRAAVEYVDAMANLSRRAGHRAAVQDHYYRRLKQGLAARYRIDPALPDAAFAARAAAADAAFDGPALGALLARLAGQSLSDADLVTAAAEVAQWLTAQQGRAY